MLSNLTGDHVVYAVLAVVGATVIRLLLRGDSGKKNELWSRIDKVGVPSGLLPWTRAIVSSITALQRNTHEGYNKFSKHGRPFALPNMWTGKPIIVVPQSALHLVNRPESEIIGFWALCENFQLQYFIPEPIVFEKVIHFEVARKDLTKRNMERQLKPTVEELKHCFGVLWGDSKEWTTVNAWDMCGQIMARTALRTLLGYPLCRDQELVETTRLFANNLFASAAIINCIPPFLRPVLAPLMALKTKRNLHRYRKTVIPFIEERIRLWRKHEDSGEGEQPSDFLQWLIPRAAQHGPEHLDPSTLAYRLLALNTMFIYGMSFIFAQAVIDLIGCSDSKRYKDGILRECDAVFAEYPDGVASREAVERLHRLDSAIRESMRLSDVGVTMLPRDIVGNKPLDLGDGLICPPGTRLSWPAQPIQRDPEFWENPLHFDAFRFSDPFDEEAGGVPSGTDGDGAPSKDRENLTDLTTSFLAWGYGRKACPGRWYASHTIKQSIAYMLMNYEVELVDPLPERKALLQAMIPPTGVRMRYRRRI